MIFYVEDDPEIRNLIQYTLTASGFDSKVFPSSEPFFSEIKKEKPDLILLDIMLPGEDGLAILKKLKQDNATKSIPVIMSTAKGSEYDKVVGLESGADDYLVKPFGMMEMIARIKALLRRSSSQIKEKQILSYDQIELDDDMHTIKVSGEQINLTLKEYELLKLFLSNIGHVFTRDALLETVWGMDYIGESRTIDVHVGTLRTKLGKSGDLIQTIRGVGYKMVRLDEETNI